MPRGRQPGIDGSAEGRPGSAAAVLGALLLALLPGRAAGQGRVEVTGEERAWLAAHPTIRLAADPAFPPLEWFDQEGRYVGLVADYFKLIEARLGVPIEVVRVQSWDEALRRARAREVDGLTAAQPTAERAAFLLFTAPILDIPNVVIARAGTEGDFSLSGLSGRRVAVTQGYATQEHLRSTYPAIQVVPEPDDLSCLTDVSFGRVDAAVLNLAVATWLIEQHGIFNLRVAADSGRSNPLAIGVRSDEPRLRDILGKGLASVTQEERQAIRSRWLRVEGGHFLSAREVKTWGAGALALLLGGLFAAWAWTGSLRYQVSKATAALSQELAERQRAEAALRRSERKLAHHLDQTVMVVIEFDREYRVTYWNPAAERVLGWRREEVLGQVGDFLVPEEIRHQIRGVWQSLLLRAGGWHNVNVNMTKDGRPITCEWFNTTLLDDQAQVEGVISLAFDVSERERREEAQARAQRLESLAVLAGGIAHDFNNLLTGVMANLSLLREGEVPEAERGELLEEAEGAARRAKALTRQLLTFARGGAPAKALLDPGPVVREAALFASRGASGTCRLEVADGLWPVEGDAGQLGQVVQNLVLNALESRAGGEVTVALSNVLRGEGSAPAGPCVRLLVSDTGPGIPPGILPRIFDPFYSTKARGSGLGLAVTHSIVTRHGGQVEVRSGSEGTTFDVHLPARPDEPLPARPAQASQPPQTSLRVLVMDDEEPIRRVAHRILEGIGCRVELAADGAEAVEAWRSARQTNRPFDVVVLDLTVPGGMAGLETLEALRAIDPAVRAVVSSGYSTAAAVAEYRAHGFAAAIEKPWSSEELRRTVTEVARAPA